ncbi:RNA-directed DNA polymerase from mobile element jockey [Elysia marginata]|uniref:RNA-directed DNA polymerase from mobile element jockey n=1 Tax=Elysia marginata TaxID=1093978 RepID=A0AAV4JJM6_9GAST|nr:RNA-directed DNA polymerase from mobile element jockey [Elysia marginata]
MADVPVRATSDRFLNTSNGVISHPYLKTCKEEEFVKKVTFAKHIQIRRGEETIPTSTFVLTFDSPTPPTQIKVGYVKLNVRPYGPTPMRCFKCHRFGHERERSIEGKTLYVVNVGR